MNKILNPIAKYFNFEGRSTTFKKELIGGLSTFMAMAYILAVNPAMLSGANGGADYKGVFFLGTAISAFAATLAMGLFANVPVALAPGMGVNAFFTYTVANRILGLQLEDALIATFISGILYAIVALTPARLYIAKLLPKNFKLGIGAMIGLFLAYIGLSDSGIIVSDAFTGYVKDIPDPHHPEIFHWVTNSGLKDAGGVAQQATFTASSTSTKLGSFKDPFVIIAVVTMLLVFALHFMKVNGAAIIAMLAAIVMLAIAYGAGVVDSDKIFHIQNYGGFGKFGELSSKMWGGIGHSLSQGKIYIAIFVFLYMDFFDTTGTLFAVDEQAKLSKTDPKWMQKANLVDAGGTIFGSIMLTSTVTSYVETSVGVSQGARTGFASVVTGSAFALAIAAWPLLSCVMPIEHYQAGVAASHNTIQPVTGPILVLVGALMLSQLKHFEWSQAIDIPVLFVTLVFGMLGFSISGGIAFGVVTYYTLNCAALLMSTIKARRGKSFEINDDEIPAAGGVGKMKVKNPDFKRRVLNPVMITMFILAMTYICTMPLYAF